MSSPSIPPDSSPDSSPDPAEIAARRVGQLFAGKWRIERVLGSGGMATVYAATHINNQRTVALKVLHPEFTASGDIKKRFLREGFIANRIGHPGAVAILDDGVDDEGNVFLVMELLTGGSVADRIRAARLEREAASGPPSVHAFDQPEALRIADGVLDVLAAAHAQGIVHRDLKPDNVFLTDIGEVKVLDFGIARLRETQSGETATRTGVVLGTPQYMPPEQARGRASLVDDRSDLWAVGAIMFAMLTGRHVHVAETPNEALLKAMTATAEPIGTLLPGVDQRVAAIIDRALAFDPALRYPDARSMQNEVREAMGRVAPGKLERAPVSRGGSGGEISSKKPVTAVTGAAAPIVRDANGSRGKSGRLVSVAILLGVAVLGGRVLLGQFAPKLRAEGPTVGVDAGGPGSVPLLPAAATPLMDAGAVPGAASDAGVDSYGDILALLDAGDAGDAGDEEEEDDGGEDDEDTVETPTPATAGHARATTPAHHPGGTHKGDPHKKKKRRKKH
ncbi:MAG TPA: serine/threonine-protein kinase [Polyangiaceae bacterium]